MNTTDPSPYFPSLDGKNNSRDPFEPERLLTLRVAANKLNLPLFKMARAARAGIFPTYTLFNKRKLVRLSEVVAAIEASKQGGQNG